jgi:hypothetical protein
MSRAIGKVLGSGYASTSTSNAENNILAYLNNYDTSNYDTTLNNLTSYAANASNQLSNMGNYTFQVDGSDDAAQRAEQATYQSYVDKLTPQFETQTSDLATSLANKGLSVGSEAYQRAMTDLQNNQNSALNQAAYQSVLNGQTAYSNSLNDQIKAANFGNTSQSNYINQLLSALQNSYSGYDNALNTYQIQNGAEQRIAQNRAANSQAQAALGQQVIQSSVQNGLQSYFSSDERLKENITPVGKLNNGLTVYCFNFKGSDVPYIGLIAQEVQKVCPEAVAEGEDGFLRVRYDLACQKQKGEK